MHVLQKERGLSNLFLASGGSSSAQELLNYQQLVDSAMVDVCLTVVFEAADSACDPDIARKLVALFHFMQGKELAGQERATGAAVFASGAGCI